MNSRRQFLITAPLGLLGAVTACRNAPESQQQGTPPAGMKREEINDDDTTRKKQSCDLWGVRSYIRQRPGRIADRLKKYRPFIKARGFARKLKLNTGREWAEFCDGQMPLLGQLPLDIPRHPRDTYAGEGWKSISNSDWKQVVENDQGEDRIRY